MKTHRCSTTKNQLIPFINITAFLTYFLGFLFPSRPSLILKSVSSLSANAAHCCRLRMLKCNRQKGISLPAACKVHLAVRIPHAAIAESGYCHLCNASVCVTHRHNASTGEYRFLSTDGTAVPHNTQQCPTRLLVF